MYEFSASGKNKTGKNTLYYCYDTSDYIFLRYIDGPGGLWGQRLVYNEYVGQVVVFDWLAEDGHGVFYRGVENVWFLGV